ncbi:TPA: hypothetical protein ACGR94_005932, partial [Pseudomonas aeruginosa]
MTTSNYATAWNTAIERTQRFGLNVPEHAGQSMHSYLTPERHAEFPYVVQQALGALDFKDLVLQCLAFHYRLAPVLERWLNCPVLYTIGWVDDGTEGGMFKFDDSFIAEKLKNGHSSPTVDLHAWLTLPSMEVIDATLVTSLAIA